MSECRRTSAKKSRRLDPSEQKKEINWVLCKKLKSDHSTK